MAKKQLKKFDKGQLLPRLISPFFTEEVAKTLTLGAERYGKHNFLNATPEEKERFVNALERHLLAFRKGERRDEDDLHHLAAVATNAMMLFEIERNEKKPKKRKRR